jgi:hypothetical protein
VDIATFNVINLVLAQGKPLEGDWLLVNVARDYASIAIMRGAHLIFFRNRSADTDGTLADLVHQTAMYYEDRLSGGGFRHVFLAGATEAESAVDAVDLQRDDLDAVDIRKGLEQRLAVPVETVDPRTAAAMTDGGVASQTDLEAVTPLVGLLLRGEEAA